MRRLIGLLALLGACEPLPERPRFEGRSTAYDADREQVFDALRRAVANRYHIQRDDPAEGYLVSEWRPLYDEWDDLHFRLRVEARVQGTRPPFTIDLKVERQNREPYSGQWTPQPADADEEEQLLKDIYRSLR